MYLCASMSNSTLKQKLGQLLPVTGIVNARDLGGNPVGDGMCVRKGMLIRCAHLADATADDIAYLKSLSISKVIDFRMDKEKYGVPDKSIPGAEYISLPIDASGTVAAKATDVEKSMFREGTERFDIRQIIVVAAFNEHAQAIARDLYPTITMYPGCQKQMAAFLRLVVDSGNKPILFHCTQGKDRTGVASALLLAALGADRKTIVEDFDVTNLVYADDVIECLKRVEESGGKEKELDTVRAFIGANTSNFVKTLDSIESEYGSLTGFLKGPMGLTDDDIKILKNRYLIKEDI